MKPALTAVLLGIVALMPTVLSLDNGGLKPLEARQQVSDRKNEVDGKVVRSVLDKKRSWTEVDGDDLVSARQNGEDIASPEARKGSSQHEAKQKKNNKGGTQLRGKQGKDAKGLHQGVKHKKDTVAEKKKTTRRGITKKKKNEGKSKIISNKVQRKKVKGKASTRNDTEDAKKGGRGCPKASSCSRLKGGRCKKRCRANEEEKRGCGKNCKCCIPNEESEECETSAKCRAIGKCRKNCRRKEEKSPNVSCGGGCDCCVRKGTGVPAPSPVTPAPQCQAGQQCAGGRGTCKQSCSITETTLGYCAYGNQCRCCVSQGEYRNDQPPLPFRRNGTRLPYGSQNRIQPSDHVLTSSLEQLSTDVTDASRCLSTPQLSTAPMTSSSKSEISSMGECNTEDHLSTRASDKLSNEERR
ncbi:axoneme-associated protein mst101(2)-like [Eriocheir sinensis]|uniref:axoneme-associated protein mst101(2)-like n=1 Tax=Eriocheir sinensis TaxID=95602 RepID=UPI0021C7ADF4|nr:axoneme-associated protein mst101(2)-like [Eriocheir sinensis]